MVMIANRKTQMMTDAHVTYLMIMNDVNEIHAHNLLFFSFLLSIAKLSTNK